MFENVNQTRKSQRLAALLAVLIVAGLCITWPIGGSFGDWYNGTNAAAAEGDRYVASSTLDTCSWVMATTDFRDTAAFDTRYVWYNASGDTLYSNASHSGGVVSVETACTAGNDTGNITHDQAWTTLPYYQLWFDYTAKDAYDHGVVRILLNLSGLTSGQTPQKVRTITLKVGDVTLYSKTLSATDTAIKVEEIIEVTANELREAIINDGGGLTAFFYLEVKGVRASGLTFATSAMQIYNVPSPVGRDDALYIFGAVTVAVTFAGVFLVQPHINLPFGKKGTKKGGF